MAPGQTASNSRLALTDGQFKIMLCLIRKERFVLMISLIDLNHFLVPLILPWSFDVRHLQLTAFNTTHVLTGFIMTYL